jgi:hypothetical protein
MDKYVITNNIIDCIKTEKPIYFSKYGDGEYFCAMSHVGVNCDNDKYTEKKKNGLIESFKYIVDELPNAYIGLWWEKVQNDFWTSLVNKPVKWAYYNSVSLDREDNNKVELYKTIKHSSMKKIYICNPLLVKAEILLNIDYMIYVAFNNWFDTQFDLILEQLKNIIKDDTKYIIMTSAGMSSKILLYELAKLFPNNIYLDFGSALDKICTKQASRGCEPEYETSMKWLSDIIPPNWNDPKYDYIYHEAKTKLGLHLLKI